DLVNLFARAGIPISASEARAIKDESGGYCEGFLKRLGASEVVSVDASDYEGASVVHDMNQPVPASMYESFTAVIDSGTLEHVFNFPVAVKNCMEMVSRGGHFLGITPANNLMGHGFYQFSPELLYRIFSPANGYQIRKLMICENNF